jgi:hypothetical protein
MKITVEENIGTEESVFTRYLIIDFIFNNFHIEMNNSFRYQYIHVSIYKRQRHQKLAFIVRDLNNNIVLCDVFHKDDYKWKHFLLKHKIPEKYINEYKIFYSEKNLIDAFYKGV